MTDTLLKPQKANLHMLSEQRLRELSGRFRALTNRELLDILDDDPDNWTPEALAFAKREIKTRGGHKQLLEQHQREEKERQRQEQQRQEENRREEERRQHEAQERERLAREQQHRKENERRRQEQQRQEQNGREEQRQEHEKRERERHNRTVTFKCVNCRTGIRLRLQLNEGVYRCPSCKTEYRTVQGDGEPSVLLVVPTSLRRGQSTDTASKERKPMPPEVRSSLVTFALGEQATFDDVRQAYRAHVKQYHPDMVSHLGSELRKVAEMKTKEFNAAYQILERFYAA